MLTVHEVNMTYLVSDNAVSVLVWLVVWVTNAEVQHREARTPKPPSSSPSCFHIDVRPVKPSGAAQGSPVWHGGQKMFPKLLLFCLSTLFFTMHTVLWGRSAGLVCCGRDGNGSPCSQFPLWHRHSRFLQQVRAHRGNMQPCGVKALTLSFPGCLLHSLFCLLLLPAALSCFCVSLTEANRSLARAN